MPESTFCIFYPTSTALTSHLFLTLYSAGKSRAMTKITVIAEQSLDSHRSIHSTHPAYDKQLCCISLIVDDSDAHVNQTVY